MFVRNSISTKDIKSDCVKFIANLQVFQKTTKKPAGLLEKNRKMNE